MATTEVMMIEVKREKKKESGIFEERIFLSVMRK